MALIHRGTPDGELDKEKFNCICRGDAGSGVEPTQRVRIENGFPSLPEQMEFNF